MNLEKILTTEITVKGSVETLKKDSGLNKAVTFRLRCTTSKIIKEIGINPYTALPCYSPFILYKLSVKMNDVGGFYNVNRVLKCSRLFGKRGIPANKLSKMVDKKSREKLESITHINSLESLESIGLSKSTKRLLKSVCAPYFREKIFFDMLRYFPYSLLKRYSDNKLKEIKQKCIESPFLMCFRTSFIRVLDKKKKIPSKLKYTYSIDNNRSPKYSLERWQYFVRLDDDKPKSISFVGSSPMWNVEMLSYFCQDNGITFSEQFFRDIANYLFIYIACEREHALLGSSIFDIAQFNITESTLDFFSRHNIVKRSKYALKCAVYPSLEIVEESLCSALYNCARKIKIITTECKFEDMLNIISTDVEFKDKLRESVAIFPQISVMYYLQAKIESLQKVERQRPKRGRKRKSQDVTTLDLEDEVDVYKFYHVDQWLSSEIQYTREVYIISAQDMDSQTLLSVLLKIPKDVETVTLVGNPGLWCPGLPNVFSSIVSAIYLIGDQEKFQVKDIWSERGKSTVKNCDIYHNEEKFSEFLNDWMKYKDTKWDSKMILFSNKSMRDQLFRSTMDRVFKYGSVDALYVESFIYVVELGLYGIIKSAHMLNYPKTWVQITDQSLAMIPNIRRYMLMVEDYYTKTPFSIDTKMYRCINPLFSLVSEAPTLSIQHVIMVADEKTTYQDISRAAAIGRDNFTLYCRKNIDIDTVICTDSVNPNVAIGDILQFQMASQIKK